MGALGFIIAIILCGIIVKISEWWENRKEKKIERYVNRSEEIDFKTGTDKPMPHVDMEMTKEIALETTNMEQTKGTRDLFMETLTKIGCQYELGEEQDDDRIYFAYQGEYFFANASNECWYVHIYDTHWGHVELYDVDEFARLRKAVNESNLNNSVMTIYTTDEAGSNVDVHCKSVILFIPQIPKLEDYLRLELNEFFRAHQFVGNEMTKLKELEESKL